MTRETTTLRIEDEVDEWLDKLAAEYSVSRSDVANRAVKVYVAKVVKGSWEDPKFSDSIDKTVKK